MKTWTPRLAAFFAAVLLVGCGAAHTKRYFQIHIVESTPKALPKIERSLRVELAAVDTLYDDIRILYRVSPYELKYYPYEFWAEKPGKMIGVAIAAFLAKKQCFSRITLGPQKETEDADFILRSRVRVLEEIDTANAWQARLAMDLEFLDVKSGKVIVERSFDRKWQLGATEIGAFPVSLSRILEEEFGNAVWALAHALEKK